MFDCIERALTKYASRRFCLCMPAQQGGQTSTAGGALSGAAAGAAAGSIIPGWGTAVGAVLGAGMGIMGAQQANSTAKANENAKKNAQDDLIMENRKRATHDYLREVRLEQLNEIQETSSLTEKSNDISKNAAAATGTAVASAAERGVAGRSLDTIISDFDFQQNQEVGRLRINQEMKNAQHTENIAASGDQFNNAVTAVQPYVPRVQPPVDYFGPIFGAIGGTAKGMKTPSTLVDTLKTPGSINQVGANYANESAWTGQVKV